MTYILLLNNGNDDDVIITLIMKMLWPFSRCYAFLETLADDRGKSFEKLLYCPH